MGSLDKYILRTAATPLFISLLIAAFLLLLEQMLRLLDFVVHQNGPVDVVWKMLAFLLPHYLGLALPISLFLGIVLAYRKLSLSSELDAMQATGISHWRILRPLMGLSLTMMVLNFLLLAYIQPYSQYGYHQLRYELQAGMLGARVPVGRFVAISESIHLKIGRTEDKGNKLYELFVAYRDKQGNRSTFTAERGQFLLGATPDTMALRLWKGRQIIDTPHLRHPGVLYFDQQDLVINLPKVAEFRGRGGEKKEATINELIDVLRGLQHVPETSFHEYQASFHFRLIHTFTFFSLPFLAASLGTTNKRRPSGAGPTFGIAMIVLYHELLEEWGENGVAAGDLSPFFSMWLLFIIFSVIAIRFYIGVAEKPEYRPTYYIDTLWASVRDQILLVNRWLRRA